LEIKSIVFKALHKPSGKIFYFREPMICAEYDALMFMYTEGQDEYKLRAGHSGLPSNDIEEYVITLEEENTDA